MGREHELRDFNSLLAADSRPRIVFVHGPGGIGKSSLLDGFQSIAERAGNRFSRLDARLLPATPAGVAQAVERATAGPEEGSRVLAVDHTERLATLDGWLRTELIPSLPADIVLVLAGRHPPGPEWRADPGLHSLLVDYELEPLEATAVTEYLRRRGVPVTQRGAIREFAHGHPLALALAVDQVLRHPEKTFDATRSPDLIHALVEWLLRDVEDPRHLEALAACAAVRRLDEPLLAAMLDSGDVRAEFEWLAGQNFVERQAGGLVIHDLVREIVVQDLRGRNLARHHELIRRAAEQRLAGLESATQAEMLQASNDAIYTLRHEPLIQPRFAYADIQYYPDTARTEERPSLAAEVEKLEGAESRSWFEHWLDREDAELVVMRDSARRPVALALILRFTAAGLAKSNADPCIRALHRHLDAHAPLRGNEQAMLVRFLMVHDTHQAITPAWAQLMAHVSGLVFTPGISLLCFAADPASPTWLGYNQFADAGFLEHAEYRVGERRYCLVANDLRRELPRHWARKCVLRILQGGSGAELRTPPIVALKRPAFDEAVRQALNSFHDEAALARSPLLRSPMLRRYSDRCDTDALRALLRETSAECLAGGRPPCSLHAVIERTCFRPAAKQHAAAAELHVSERTLRRRLREARTRLTEALWERETSA